MSYDYDYYSGADLRYPRRWKPTLVRNPSSCEARAFADDLEDYERNLESYKEDISYYKDQIGRRLDELKNKLIGEYVITEAQMCILWRRAWETGHSAGLHEVVNYFDEYYSMASEFAALQKG